VKKDGKELIRAQIGDLYVNERFEDFKHKFFCLLQKTQGPPERLKIMNGKKASIQQLLVMCTLKMTLLLSKSLLLLDE
jgi:hypothetical protein